MCQERDDRIAPRREKQAGVGRKGQLVPSEAACTVLGVDITHPWGIKNTGASRIFLIWHISYVFSLENELPIYMVDLSF